MTVDSFLVAQGISVHKVSQGVQHLSRPESGACEKMKTLSRSALKDFNKAIKVKHRQPKPSGRQWAYKRDTVEPP